MRYCRTLLIAFITFLVVISPNFGQNLSILFPANRVLAQTPNQKTNSVLSGNFVDYFAEERQFKGHEGSVNSASFSPDGKRIVTAGSDATARIWDFSGKELLVLQGHQGSVRSANFSSDAQLIVTASFDGTARVWNNSGQQLAELKGHQGNVNSASFSPDGKRVVTAGADKTVRIWDISGKQLAEFKEHEGSIYSANFSPDGQRIVTAAADKTARVWDLSGKMLAQLQGHTDTVWSANFSPDGKQIVTASDDKTARVWDLSGKVLAELKRHSDSVYSASFSPDGQKIVTASVDFTSLLWDSSGKLLGKLQQHTGGVNSARFSADGKFIVTSSNDGTARIWDTQSKILTQLQGHQAKLWEANFSPDGKLVLTAGEDGTARLWDISTQKLLLVLKENNDSVTSASFSPDGKLILTSSAGSIHVWDISGKLITEIVDYENFIQRASFSPDGRLIIANGQYGSSFIWDISGKLIAKIKGSLNRNLTQRFPSFSPDGKQIITVSDSDKTAWLWDLAGNLLAELKGPKSPGSNVITDFSPDGQKIVVASGDPEVSVWNTSGKLLLKIQLNQRYVNSAVFSLDGKSILTVADKVSLWDLSGNLLMEMPLTASFASFSPNGKSILTETNNIIRVWDLSGALLAELKGENQSNITSTNFSPDGQQVITASEDYTARIWYLTDKQQAQQKLPETPFSDYVEPKSTIGITEAYISFSPDAKYVIVYSGYGIAHVWDISGKLLAELKGVTDEANFSPDGQKIVTTANRIVRVWDIYGNLLAEFEGGDKAKFSADGKRIITSSWNGFARISDTSGKLVAELKGGEAKFSADGKLIVTNSSDGILRVWDINGKLIAELKGHEDIVTSASFSPDGQQIVTTSKDKTARLWNIFGKQLVLLKGHQGKVTSASFSPNGKQIITIAADGNYDSVNGTTKTAILWNLDGKLRKEFKQLQEVWGAGDSASFSPDGQKILTVSHDDTVHLWDLSGKKLVDLTSVDGKGYVNSNGKAFVKSASFSPDGKLILVPYNGNTVRVWNSSGKLVAELKGGLNNNASFTPDGKKILTLSQDTTARVWDLSGKLTAVLQQGNQVRVNSASFSPDGQIVVAVMENNTPRLWDVSGKFRAELQGHEFWVRSAAFSPDSKLIVTTSDDGTARIWNTLGKQVAILQGHEGSLTNANFSSDGKRIIASTNNNTSYIWDTAGKLINQTNENLEIFHADEELIVAESQNNNDNRNVRILNNSGKLIAEIKGHQDKVNTAHLSRDGKLIVTASNDGTVRVWDTSSKQLAILELPAPVFSPRVQADRLRDLQYYAPNCAQAFEPWQKALKIYQEISDNKNQAVILEQLGNAYYCLSDYTNAINSYTEASTISQKHNYPEIQARNLSNLGGIYNSLADYDQALNYYAEALKIIQQQDTQLKAEILRGRGEIYNLQGKYNEAIKDYSQALAIDDNLQNVYGIAKDKVNLANIYYVLDDYSKAIQYYKETLDFTPSESLAGLGNTYLSLGNTAKAVELHQQSLAKAQNENKEAVGNALNNLAYAWIKSNNLPEAEKNLLEAIKIWESLRAGLNDANKVSIFEKQFRTYRLLQEVLIAQNKINEALEISERGRSRAFVELLARRLSPNQTQQSSITPPNIEQIKQIAKLQNATLVQYSIVNQEDKQKIKESEIYIWVVKPTGEVAFHRQDIKPLLQKENKTLAQLVDISRLSIGVRSRAGGIIAAAADGANQPKRLQQLHDLLIKPIANQLPSSPSDRIIFIPQGSLFLVPFPALQDAQNKYLVEKHTILTAPSIQLLDLTRQQKLSHQGKSASLPNLVVGNPTMPFVSLVPGGKAQQLPALDGAEKEAKAIAPLLKTKAIIGSQATETAIAQKMTQSRIIHLATHGLFDDLRGLGSAIALAPAGKDDGLLTAEEILDLKLQAELVVLSACDTGRGKITGDGVIGLSRSFISAGVPSIVVSLWQVPDTPTASLMTEFYQHSSKNSDKAAALRQAMLTTMKTHPDPVNWAAFTLIGEVN
ncbi:WD-40 repeat-containing protein [Tolypothrix tenuis PCC 7101]|uniref:WD-40 repeat-containing protein n=1 Tax=Tolypothrix tenuis PCC 7101 TaxID=231146 RepID=A0A1Z4N4U9_9CYAN|nr:CHAT domain-containing protein [Aulosira sp. FACHB-113]BAZ00727.1 WD-40 repeat-containing protein [Tolypothrix tenuis PCC 7101]BAZ75350.1 WD-40 repeat-containing protein [Aulosira laxa NIES-50]